MVSFKSGRQDLDELINACVLDERLGRINLGSSDDTYSFSYSDGEISVSSETADVSFKRDILLAVSGLRVYVKTGYPRKNVTTEMLSCYKNSWDLVLGKFREIASMHEDREIMSFCSEAKPCRTRSL